MAEEKTDYWVLGTVGFVAIVAIISMVQLSDTTRELSGVTVGSQSGLTGYVVETRSSAD